MERGKRFLVCEKLEKNQKTLLNIALSLANNVAEAQDLLQETSFVILANADKYNEQGRFIAWAARIMKNIYVNNEKLKAVRATLGYDDISAEDSSTALCEPLAAYSSEFLDFIAAGLPPHQAEVMSRTMEGYSCNEIAKEVGCSVCSVKNRLHNARVTLRNKFGK